MKITLIILVSAVIATSGWFLYHNTHEASVWTDLQSRVPAKPLTSTESIITNGEVFAKLTPENYEVGHIQLANGDIWRFAFLSHHILGGSDSLSVFSGPSGIFRVRGGYFCCEVQFSDAETHPKDSVEFIAFLRRHHQSVEQVQ